MLAFIASHGGVIAVGVTIMMTINLVLSTLSQLLHILGKQSPDWLSKILGYVKTALDWLSANVQHPTQVDPETADTSSAVPTGSSSAKTGSST